MSHKPTVTDIRLKSTITYLTPVVALLNELGDTFGTPFVPAISTTTLSLITPVQNVKKNKDNCIQLLENIYQLLCAIVNLHIKSETKGNLSLATLHHVGKFTETLHKVHAFVEAQQDGSKIKYLFRQMETKALLGECQAGLQQAFEVFRIQLDSSIPQIETGMTALGNITEMQEEAEMMHQEVLEWISTLSDGPTSDRSTRLMDPRIGGMGKTTLAKAALYHPEIASKYEQCFFVVADSVTTSVELSGLIGEHIGFKPAKDLTKQVIHYFATTGPSLLILDNLETSWEPIESRGEIEELLAKLTDVPHLALMASITMRGAERPAKVQWTRPFLAPLKPLSDLAARDTFFAIAEDVHDSRDVNKILSLTDNMPLAVDLIAHAVNFEGSCSAVLARWKSERTSLLSAGNDRKSDLDTSITISLSSSRMSAGAKDLLSLLSMLPDGLSDVELVQSKLSMNDIMTCKATLLATSLAYIDDNRRLKSLVPIREHMQCFYPPSPLLIHPLQKYFHELLDLYWQYPRTQRGAGGVKHLALNVRNMGELLLRGLNQDNPNLAETIDCTLFDCTLSMKGFTQDMDPGCYPLIPMLMDQIETVLPTKCNEKLRAQLILWKFESSSPSLSSDADMLITEAISHFCALNDPVLESSDRHGPSDPRRVPGTGTGRRKIFLLDPWVPVRDPWLSIPSLDC
ncbi:hypothetical protein FB451DRAFT_1536745 [Mycena latifolia]|nr:hypothetical protein FB451DRAFT_1536745 [Mycena latifolia]